MRQAVKEGRVAAGTVNTRTPKVKDTGLKGGWGASAFFYKQVRELGGVPPLLFVNSSTVSCWPPSSLWVLSSGTQMTFPPTLFCDYACMGVYVLFFLNAAGEGP